MSSSSGQPQLSTQLDHLAARYQGSGHADLTRHEWAVQQHRDSIASYLGHSSLVEYFALAEGISVARARLNLLERMHRPVGDPPAGDAKPGAKPGANGAAAATAGGANGTTGGANGTTAGEKGGGGDGAK